MSATPIVVIQCSLEGEDIQSFPSAQKAAISLGGRSGTPIIRSVKYGVTAYGYRWRYLGKPLVERRSDTAMGKARRVVVTSSSGEYIATYPSQSEASRQLGIGISLIESLLMTGGSSQGYHFYLEELGDKQKERSRFSRPIVALNDDSSVYKEYASVKEAAIDLGVIPAAIYAALRKSSPNARCKGHRFRYKQDLGLE